MNINLEDVLVSWPNPTLGDDLINGVLPTCAYPNMRCGYESFGDLGGAQWVITKHYPFGGNKDNLEEVWRNTLSNGTNIIYIGNYNQDYSIQIQTNSIVLFNYYLKYIGL